MARKFLKMLSPIGTARFAYLNTPSDHFTPIFKTDLIVKADACVEFCKILDEKNQESYEEQCKKHPKNKKAIRKHPPYQLEVDDDGEETGNVIFKFKTLPTTQKKDGSIVEKRLKAFDSKAKPIEMPSVYTGSTIRVEFTPVSYYNPSTKESGISLRILSVQILDLVTFDTNGKARGYEEEEGYSYVGQPVEVKESASTPPTEDKSDDQETARIRKELTDLVVEISRMERKDPSEVVRELTQDSSGFGGKNAIIDIPVRVTRSNGSERFPMVETKIKAEDRLDELRRGNKEEVPFPLETAKGR